MLLAFFMSLSMSPVLIWAFLEWRDEMQKQKMKYKENPNNDE